MTLLRFWLSENKKYIHAKVGINAIPNAKPADVRGLMAFIGVGFN
ncbi:MAG: hypothetical protein WC101_02680 [Candidatus Gracilibacteria bacterium]